MHLPAARLAVQHVLRGVADRQGATPSVKKLDTAVTLVWHAPGHRWPCLIHRPVQGSFGESCSLSKGEPGGLSSAPGVLEALLRDAPLAGVARLHV